MSTFGTLFRNLAAYGASEAASKLSRLFVVVALARTLSPAELGLAALALAAGDILKSLTENGAGHRIIAARAAELESTCRAAHRIFWVWCIGLFLVQAGVAALLWLAFAKPFVALMILLLGIEYLFMPAGLVQAALAAREGKLRQTAAISGGQIVLANLLTVLLALVWPSAMALILPRILTAPLWTLAMRRLRPWYPARHVQPAPLRPFLRFGAPVLGIEVVKSLRLQADKVVVGALLGAEVLGLYFMAFNAGLSLANSFSVAFAKVLFPHLCTCDDRATGLRQSFGLSLGVITPVVLLQAWFAPVYVPFLLGPAWAELSQVVAILCLAAIPTLLWTGAAGWLRAENRPEIEFAVTVFLTVALLLNAWVMAPYGLTAIAWGYLAVASATMTLASLPALSFAFNRNSLTV